MKIVNDDTTGSSCEETTDAKHTQIKSFVPVPTTTSFGQYLIVPKAPNEISSKQVMWNCTDKYRK